MSSAAAAALVAAAVAVALASRAGSPGRRSDERPAGAPATARSAGSVLADRWTDWRTRRSDASPDALAHWLDDVGRRLRRGESATLALGVVPHDRRTARETARLRLALARGASVAAAADEWCAEHETASDRREGVSALSVCSAVIACAAEVGGSLAEPVDRLAVAMRERSELDRDRRTQSAQARLSAVVLSCLPIAVLGALAVADSGVREVITSPLGASIVAAGVGLDALGGWWMHHITQARP